MLEWLTQTASVFKIQHNAQHEFHMSVEQHLMHRARIGNSPLFLDARDRDASIKADMLWELRVTLLDGATLDIAGSSLENCIMAARSMVEPVPASMAA